MRGTHVSEAARVGRVTLRVGDVDRAATFYETVVGLELVRRDAAGAADGGTTVTLGAGGTPLLCLLEDANAPPRRRDEAGLFHTAFLVPTRAALGAALERIETRASLTGASDHLVSEALYLRDPEGNGIEIYRDKPRSEWPTADGRVRMDTLPLNLEPLRAAARDRGPAASAPNAADATARDGVPPGTTVGHVHLETTSLPRAEAFYVDALGLRVRQRMGSALFLAAGDYHHHLGLNTWNGRSAPRQSGSRGLERFEFLVPADDAVDAVRVGLETAGYDVRRADDDAVVATDPAGIDVRIAAGA